MEAELDKFRRKKKQEEDKLARKAKMEEWWGSITNTLTRAVLPIPEPQAEIATEEERESLSDDGDVDVIDEDPSVRKLKYILLASKILIWLLLFIGCVELGFGAVYFIVSSLFLIYYNTRTSGKRKGEISAYSVFNENCESLVGTLKAEHLESQLLYQNKN